MTGKNNRFLEKAFEERMNWVLSKLEAKSHKMRKSNLKEWKKSN